MSDESAPVVPVKNSAEFRYWCRVCHVMYRGDAARRHANFMRVQARAEGRRARGNSRVA